MSTSLRKPAVSAAILSLLDKDKKRGKDTDNLIALCESSAGLDRPAVIAVYRYTLARGLTASSIKIESAHNISDTERYGAHLSAWAYNVNRLIIGYAKELMLDGGLRREDTREIAEVIAMSKEAEDKGYAADLIRMNFVNGMYENYLSVAKLAADFEKLESLIRSESSQPEAVSL